jgi:hypothetical protein
MSVEETAVAPAAASEAVQQPAGDPSQSPATPPVPAESPAGNSPRVRGSDGRFVKGGREAFVAKAQAIEAKAVAEQTRQVVEQQAEESTLAAVADADDDDGAEQLPAAGQAPPAASAAASSEGPSEDLLMVAQALGVPDYVISMAKSDDALRIAIALNNADLTDNAGGGEQSPAQRQAPQQRRQEQEAEPLVPEDLRVKMLLPDDYSDPEDPMFQQQKHLVDRVAELQELVAHLAVQQMQSVNERQSNAKLAAQQQFDAALDATEWEIVGKRSEFKSPNDIAFLTRKKMYGAFEQLSQALPQMPAERLVELAYEQTFGKRPAPKKSPKEAARLAALQRSNGRILGSGSGGPPAAEPKLSKKDQFLRRIAEIKARQA